jgi:predicted lipoprotein
MSKNRAVLPPHPSPSATPSPHGRGSRASGTALILAVALSLGGCKLVAKTDATAAAAQGTSAGAATDPTAMARAMWSAKVVPYLESKAGPFNDVRAMIKQSPDAAGQKFGYRERAEGVPWTMIARLEGAVTAANTESRAATVDVDTDGDGTADAAVQIGPVIRGTALRDSLDFVSFGSFTNQIDFAQFGKALNTEMADKILSSVPRENLVGRKISVVGVFPLDPAAAKPLITPAKIEIAPSS